MPNQRMRSLAALLFLLLVAGCSSAPEPPRLTLLVTIDTLRADRLGAYGSERGLTPKIDALAATAERFTAAYAPSSITLPSIAALLTGRYPLELGLVNNEGVLDPGTPTLAGELGRRGFRTHAVVSNFVLRRASGLARGFDSFDDSFPQRERQREIPERIGADTTVAALAALDACTAEPGPCLLWVHYQDPHGPYTPPGTLRAERLAFERDAADGRRQLEVRSDNLGMGGIPKYQFLDGQREVAYYRAGYDAEIAYLDLQVGALLDGIEQRGLLESALVVLAADHGESLGERDYWFAHGEYLDDPLVRVPLLVRRPGAPPATRDDLVSLVDLFPTLLALLAPDASVAGPGRNLFAPDARERESSPYLAALDGATALRFGIVRGRYKLVVSRAAGRADWQTELYRRGHEDENLVDEFSDYAASLRAEVLAVQREQYRGAPRHRQTLSPADREKLRALGYVDP